MTTRKHFSAFKVAGLFLAAAVLLTLSVLCGPGQAAVVSYWNLDEAGGNTLADSIGPNDITAAAGATVGVPGKFGNAVNVDGSNKDAVSAGTLGLPFGASTASVSYWINKNSNAGTQVHYSYGTASDNLHRGAFDSSNGTIYFFYHFNNDTSVNPLSPTLDTGNWHLFVNVFDAENTQRRIYYDGALVATQNDINNVNVTDSQPFRIGGEDRGFMSNAIFDDVAVWDHALTDQEVAFLWNNGAGNVAVNPIPEPSTLVLLALGLLGLLFGRRRRRK